MLPEARKYLFDMAQAALLIVQFLEGRAFDDYEADPMLRSAVERQLGIIGEALVQLSRVDEGVAANISESKRIVAFRNILIHGYRQVDDRLVWDVVESKLPTLQHEVAVLLDE